MKVNNLTNMGHWVCTDGGRKEAGHKKDSGGGACLYRAIAIISELPYQVVYDKINELAKTQKIEKKPCGLIRRAAKRFLKELGFKWVNTDLDKKVHLKASELPKGRIIVRMSRHYCAVIDGIIYDTHDCSNNGKFIIDGYFCKE